MTCILTNLACVLQEELNQANAEMLRRKDLKTKQEKMEELKVVEYMKQKAVSVTIKLNES